MRYVTVARLEELALGEMRRVEVGDEGIVVFRTPDGIFATEDYCSHRHVRFSLGELEGNAVRCPLDGGTFDVRTGKPIVAPCSRRVKTFKVRIEGDAIQLALDH